MRSSLGLTLVEVVLAILILAVGIIGAGALQANGLRATRTSQVVQELDAAARSAVANLRLQYQSADPSGLAPVTVPTNCPDQFDESCNYTAVPCSLAGSTLVCSAGSMPRDAWAITVNASGQGHDVVLNTLVMSETP